MAQPVIQHSFNSGEWAPNLYARTDIEKFHSGAALLRNFYVDYRGGASTRSGTKYLLRGYKDSTAIRLIPFQASFTVKFALEFGDSYVRFYANGAPVLETGLNITGATQANPVVLSVVNTYTTGDVDWVYITGVGGMTELNGNYYIVHARTNGTVTLYDLFGNPVDGTLFGAWIAGGTTQRIYTLASPYAAADLALLKFVQNVNTLIITHPSYVPYALMYTSATSWSLAAITFGTTVGTPTNVVLTQQNLGGGTTWNNSYIVTAMDASGQESVQTAPLTIQTTSDLRTVAGTITISWSPVAGARSYNVYKSETTNTVPIPVGVPYGYIGNVDGTSMVDSNIIADFSQPPPDAQNPFATGSEVTATTIGTAGSYTTAPTCTFSAPPSGTTTTGTPVLGVVTATVSAGGANYGVGDQIICQGGVVLTVATLAVTAVATVTITNVGSETTLPANPVAQISSTGAGTAATFTLHWGVISITIIVAGSGYSVAPTITFSAGAAAATATLGPASNGNPSVPAFFQQRLVLAGPPLSPQTLDFSQPGSYFNYNTSTPVQDDNAISATIVSGQLNNIKALIAQPGGLIVLTDGASFLINGGSLGSAITPAAITSNSQSYIGCNDMPPIVSNFDILTVSAKGSSVRDSTYNFYANVYTGSDISVIASHLFFGYKLTEWAWAEEPYKLVWAVRNDGTLLSLTFLKEQEFTAWAHHDTGGVDATGKFKSVCTIVEAATVGNQNFLYTVVQRTVNATTVQYIEMMPERSTTGLVKDAWTVDAGLQYSGAPVSTFTGAQHLAGLHCTGLADGTIIADFVMPASGTFTPPGGPYSKVTVGIAFVPQLQTLYLDIGNPTIQSKMKKINAGTVRVTDTLGLQIGTSFSNLVDMKDLIRGNVGSMTNTKVTDLVTGDARTFLDPLWQEAGTYCIQQTYPYPASILGVIPQLAVGDTASTRG